MSGGLEGVEYRSGGGGGFAEAEAEAETGPGGGQDGPGCERRHCTETEKLRE